MVPSEADIERGQDGGALESFEMNTPPSSSTSVEYRAVPGDETGEVPDKSKPAISIKSDWSSQLDSTSNIEVSELHAVDHKWEDRDFKLVPKTLALDESTAVRLYLVEGITLDTIKNITGIPGIGVDEEFFRYHCLNDLVYDRTEISKYFFAKWPRRVRQTPRQWKIEARIAAKRPWDLEVIIDPHDLLLDHDRYKSVGRVYRPHAPLESKPPPESAYPLKPVNRPPARKKTLPKKRKERVDTIDKDIVVEEDRWLAAGECVSCYFEKVGNSFIGVINFDKPPEVEVKQKTYVRSESNSTPTGKGGRPKPERTREPRFDNFRESRVRFRDSLTRKLKSKEALMAFKDNPMSITKDILLQFILDDHKEIITDLGGALDYIDESMSDNAVLRKSLLDWRILFGLWRKLLWHDLSAIDYVNGVLKCSRLVGDGGAPQLEEFTVLSRNVGFIKKRLDSTFMAIMSTMGIVESQKAISQAKTISKLTNLAFFFIPLTLTAGIFGMNIVEWENKLKFTTWAGVSLSILLFTYIVLYIKEISIALSRGPSHLQSLDPASAPVVINRQSMYLRYYVGYYGKRAVKPLAFLALTAGIVMGIWAIATKTHLSSDEKASVGFGFAAALPILLLVWLPLLARKRSETSRLRKCFLLLCLGVVLGLVAVAIWGIFAQNNSFSHGKRVSLSVFLAVFVPCVFSLVVLALNPDIGDDHITYFVLCLLDVLIVAYAAIIWAIATKSHLSHSGKVGVSILVSMVPISGIFSLIVSS